MLYLSGKLFYIFISSFFLIIYATDNGYTTMKFINSYLYIGGVNFISKNTVTKSGVISQIKKQTYKNYIFNGSDIGFTVQYDRWPKGFPSGTTSLAFDNCLNWKDEHTNDTIRMSSYDQQRYFHHTYSGDWKTMNYTCLNNFIKGIEKFDDDHLWICGTFGGFPRAFKVKETDLSFGGFVDSNVMSCSRYIDEPMATYRDNSSDQLYVASGWGLYKPSKTKPDIRNNNSTMMYADWRLYRNLFPLPGTMSWVLSSDVNFLKVVSESDDHLYFFGHEINNQYGLNNQEDRHAWQSFMLRICKKDRGFKYVPKDLGDEIKFLVHDKYYSVSLPDADYIVGNLPNEVGYNQSWYRDQVHLPTTHFTTPMKINFGCYMGRKPRSISDNHFWGDTNVVYFNRLADVLFDPKREIKFTSGSKINETNYFGCNTNEHSQIPLIGLFNSPGFLSTGVEPIGALCQLQINENMFPEVGTKKTPYQTFNAMEAPNAYDEIMSISSTSVSNFYSRSLHRTSGHALHPFWNQGVLMGDRFRISDPISFDHIGTCGNDTFFKSLNEHKFLKIMNVSNTAWPNELPNRLSSITSAVCQYSAAELYGFNATFVMPGVEFKRIFLIKSNITNYKMHKLSDETKVETERRRFTSPLMIVAIITTRGDIYRVVLCDFDNAIANNGRDQFSSSWFNWCIFRHTNQPYIYRQYTPMEKRTRGESVLFRASSLLKHRRLYNVTDKIDPHSHYIKEVLKEGDNLIVLTKNKITQVKLNGDCESFNRCIDCASDPDCMWDIANNKCVLYSEKIYNDGTHVQDVLDRGFLCRKLVQNHHIIEYNMLIQNNVVVLHCTSSYFWRGKIGWKYDKGDIIQSSNTILMNKDDSVLTILDYSNNKTTIKCFGILEERDALFSGKEYENRKNISDIMETELNTFKIVKINMSLPLTSTLSLSIDSTWTSRGFQNTTSSNISLPLTSTLGPSTNNTWTSPGSQNTTLSYSWLITCICVITVQLLVIIVLICVGKYRMKSKDKYKKIRSIPKSLETNM